MQENDPKRLLSNHAVIQSRCQNMEMFAFTSAVRGYRISYLSRPIKPSIGEKLVAEREFDNTMDKHALKVVKGDETFGHLPPKFSHIT